MSASVADMLIFNASCAGAAPATAPTVATTARPTTRLSVKFGGIGNTPDRALFVAQDLGYFEAQNLDVQVTSFQSAGEMTPLLATGKLDAANGGSSPGFFNAVSSGVPLKIVSDLTLIKDWLQRHAHRGGQRSGGRCRCP